MRYSAANITTVVMMGLTVWAIGTRIRARPDSNWPLIYYIFLVAYHQAFSGTLHPWAVYIGVICALFLRFEFLGGTIRWIFVTVELIVLGFVLYMTWHALSG